MSIKSSLKKKVLFLALDVMVATLEARSSTKVWLGQLEV